MAHPGTLGGAVPAATGMQLAPGPFASEWADPALRTGCPQASLPPLGEWQPPPLALNGEGGELASPAGDVAV